jgi:hypothetical protein
MKHKLLRYLTFSALSLSLVIGSPAAAIAQTGTTPTETETCYAMTMTSGATTQTAGYTETTQTGPTTAVCQRNACT